MCDMTSGQHYYAVKVVMIVKAHENSMLHHLIYGYAGRLTRMFRRWNSGWIEDKTTQILPTGETPVILDGAEYSNMVLESDVKRDIAYKALESVFRNNLDRIF